ncbi:MAG: phage major capsid protein [Terrisporobacter sp.]|uniref:phage major capsid protein n=1 Tax=Terrisporobacter sp. TaxID=1965305 RepID=UPI002A91ACF9|nr:phage major capsid protein [Terrisporobacter sp.]MDY6153159.1 phage major capsid protein [Terrisporobacter sp.]
MAYFHINEALENINKLRTAANEAVKAGKTPDVKPETFDLMERMTRNMWGDFSKGRASIQEALTTTDTVSLIPKIIEGKLREAAEPEYLGTKFFNTIHVEGGSSAVYVIPVVGELQAYEVGEGGRYKESYADMNTIENSTLEVRVRKIGTKVSITEEAISDSSWDILGLNVRKMGRAMARYKEEMIFNNFTEHGHIVFDNNIRSANPEAGTTGRGQDGMFNDTLSVEDFLDLTLTLMSNGYNPTDVIMHPLTWVVFARNSMIGNGLTFGALGGNNVHPNGGIQGTPAAFGLANNGDGQKMIMTPDQVQNRLPMPLTINFSPFVNFNKERKTFDMYCLDNREVGVIVQKEGLTTENWTDPEKDIRNLKCKERYGVGILNNGKSITVAKGIAVAPSYPLPPVVRIDNTK